MREKIQKAIDKAKEIDTKYLNSDERDALETLIRTAEGYLDLIKILYGW